MDGFYKRSELKKQGVLLDTSFLIHLTKNTSKLHHKANALAKYLSENGFDLYVSTIAIAEFCVGGKYSDLIARNYKFYFVDFKLHHAEKAANFIKKVSSQKKTAIYL